MLKKSNDDEDYNIDIQPNENDVVCVRGKRPSSFIGNRRFSIIIDLHKENYRSSTKKEEKTRLAMSVIRTIERCSPKGRFLKKDSKGEIITQMSEQKARQAVTQAFRDALSIVDIDQQQDSSHSLSELAVGTQIAVQNGEKSPAAIMSKEMASLVMSQQNHYLNLLQNDLGEDDSESSDEESEHEI